MAIGETAELAILLNLKGNSASEINRTTGALRGLDRQASLTQQGISKIGQGLRLGITNLAKLSVVAGTAVVGGITAALKSGIDSLNELQAVEAQTAAVIKSTGSAAGISAKQIRDRATALEDLTTIDDKTVQSGENLLLTFTNIKNAAGAGNDVFNQTANVMLDVATAMNKGNVEGIDLKTTAIQLGKALNDPVKGITALTRIGVTFTKQQKEQIKDAVKHNDLLGAQKIILAELNKEFGGSAAAQVGTYAGQQRRLADAFEDLKITLAQGALPGLTSFTKSLADALRSPEALKGAADLGKGISQLFSPANLHTAIQFAHDVLPGIAEGLKLAGAAAHTIFELWSKLPKELQGLAVAALVGNKLTGGLVASGIGDIVKGGLKGGLGGLFSRGGSPATPIFTKEVGLPGVGGGGAGGGLSAGGLLLSAGGGLAAAAAFKVLVQDPALNAQQQQIMGNAQRQLAGNPSQQALLTGVRAIETGIKELAAVPGSDQLYPGQKAFLQQLLAMYQKQLVAGQVSGPSATIAQKNANANQNRGGTLANISRNDLRTATHQAVVEGNRDLPKRRDMDRLGLNIGLAFRNTGNFITSVERAGLSAVTQAVWAVQAAISGLPSSFGGAAALGRGTGPEGRSTIPPALRAAGSRTGIENNRGTHISLSVHASTSARSNDSGAVTQSRYGPTAPRSGSAVVLVGS